MKKNLIVLAVTLFLTQSVFANQKMMEGPEGKPCKDVALACKSAGFSMNEKFWFDCMKPVILGQEVKGVKVDPTVVKTCRELKIAKMKKELGELESVK